MPTLSIIRLGNKCAFSYTGQVSQITRMLTQCALQDNQLAEAITQSALNITWNKTADRNADQKSNFPIEKEIFHFSVNDDSSSDQPVIQNP